MKRVFLAISMGFLLLSGCVVHRKKDVNYFPISLDLRSCNIVSYIPPRSGKSLDYLLNLESWAQNKIKAYGQKGEGLISIIEGSLNMVDMPSSKKKELSIDIVIALETKNTAQYGYRKAYIRLADSMQLDDKDVPQIKVHLDQWLIKLDKLFYRTIHGNFSLLVLSEKKGADDGKSAS